MKNLQIKLNHKQIGASKLGILSVFILIAAFLTVGLKVGPLYLDDNMVTSYSQTLIDSGEAADLSTTEFRNKVAGNLRMNNIQDFDLTSIRKTVENGEPIVTIEYEKRVPLFFNLDAVAVFNSVLK